MYKLASTVAMCLLSASSVVYSNSSDISMPFPVVVERADLVPAVETVDASTVVIQSENSVFDVMRQRRLSPADNEIVGEPAVDVVEPQVIIAAEVVEVAPTPAAVAPTTVSSDQLDNALPIRGLYQSPNQTLGGGSGSDTLEPVALEERNDSPRSITLYASDKAANILYERDATPLKQSDGRIGVGFLFSESRDNVFTGNLMLDIHPDLVDGIRLSAGVRAYAALLGAENQDVFGAGLGVEGAYQLPTKILPLEIRGGFFYTPDIFVFGQSDRIIDYNVNVGFQLRDSLHAFAGLRFLQFDTRPGDREVDDNIHVGMRWDFVR